MTNKEIKKMTNKMNEIRYVLNDLETGLDNSLEVLKMRKELFDKFDQVYEKRESMLLKDTYNLLSKEEDYDFYIYELARLLNRFVKESDALEDFDIGNEERSFLRNEQGILFYKPGEIRALFPVYHLNMLPNDLVLKIRKILEGEDENESKK